ncbi:hypothetical protein CCZ01_05720 [Helicobacter monodelphidis]|nr:hypothetical protein CCZ01_05720 [Helicobacter sp. 15-1451]
MRRCEALAEILKEKGVCVEILLNTSPHSRNIQSADIVVIDSYLLPLESYCFVADSVSESLYFDDTMRLQYPRGIILNPALGALKLPYKESKNHRLFIGVQYALLRKEFRYLFNTPPIKIFRNEIQKIIISGGGGKIGEKYSQKIKALINKHFSHIQVDYLNPQKGLNAQEIKELFLNSDLAISAAGGTLNELAICGTPSIIFCLVENQIYNFRAWTETNYMIPFESDSQCLVNQKNDLIWEQNLLQNIERMQSKSLREELSQNLRTTMMRNYWNALPFIKDIPKNGTLFA